ncbi:cation:proton antiporter [Clostridium tunisiense]|uniref:cation:proton antiporter n=1 Tax=Clostridium tunisiense TaxID=219748 RepID=UPI00031CABD3|nr:cation:proton antiporter [Clostridium tunisiense]
MLKQVILLIVFVFMAIFVGKLVAKVKLPAILGWLITGMIIGPYALGFMSNDMMNKPWFHILINLGEVAVGLMIGTELIWKDLKESGKQILVICFTEALGAFLVVTLAFGLLFVFMDIPFYLAFIFGAIALATAPAPSLSIINEYKAKGPVTKTLIPLAALDDVIGLLVFFIVMGIVTKLVSDTSFPIYFVPLMILLPIVVGTIAGFISGKALKKESNRKSTTIIALSCILGTAAVGIFINNYILPSPVMNLMLVGVTFSAVFSNMISKKRLSEVMEAVNPIIAIAMIIVILNLGAPLDYHLIIGAGLFTAVYIISRAIGKIGGSYFGAVKSNAPDTVKKYLGLTLLPHSGVSLIFTGIAVNTLIGPAPEYAEIIQGTIAAAAVINEIFAVILAKQGFKYAGELGESVEYKDEIVTDN